ncbi:acyl-CoA-binding protein, partial [Salmonella sp. s54395]|uniref:acyl-CoA-binding protein n=1 Tax=Salmonella sp. s54395 TaxID=3159664 RepID=UPI00397F772A
MSSEEFKTAAIDVKKLTTKPTDSDLLELYGLYKQATVGDCNTERPGMLDMKGKYKWDAWNSRKGMTTSESEQKYIAKVNEL